MKRDFLGTAPNVAKPRRAVVRTAERASCGAVRCARTRSMVFYAVLAAVQLREQPRQKLSERAPNRARSSAGGVGPFRRASWQCFLDDGGVVSRFRNPHRSIGAAGPARTRAHVRIARCCAATSGITNHSLLPAAQSFAAPNLNTLHFTSIGASGPQRKHERPADRSRPKAGQRQRAGPSSRSLPGSRALAVAVARRRPGAPRQRGRLPVPARADQAADARAVLLRRPLLAPATVLLLLRVRSASASARNPGA